MRTLIAILTALVLTACSDRVVWTEEVRLSDGRTIQVEQERRCEGGDYKAEVRATCVARESWLTFSLPEFSAERIVWHEALSPMVLNVHEGRLYVVGQPPTTLEFRKYGATNPPYFGYVWENKGWRRLDFKEIPMAVYENNLLIENIPKRKTKFLTVNEKNSQNSDPTYPEYFRRIDPTHRRAAY